MQLPKRLYDVSRFMSLVLRHKPEQANLTLDKQGYADVKELCKNLEITEKELDWIVDTNGKKRFAFNDDKTKIRASQGHSIQDVDLGLEPAIPPAELYHGTKEKNLKSILKEGVNKGNRQHVHLSPSTKVAQEVADRREGKSVILVIDAMFMRAEGYKFYKSDNGVWLTDHIPTKYIKVLK